MARKRATEGYLGTIHEAVAKEFMRQLEDGTKVVTKEGEVVSVSPSPALLTAICKFLKDNGIEAVADDNSNVAALAKRLEEIGEADEDTPFH